MINDHEVVLWEANKILTIDHSINDVAMNIYQSINRYNWQANYDVNDIPLF